MSVCACADVCSCMLGQAV